MKKRPRIIGPFERSARENRIRAALWRAVSTQEHVYDGTHRKERGEWKLAISAAEYARRDGLFEAAVSLQRSMVKEAEAIGYAPAIAARGGVRRAQRSTNWSMAARAE